MYDGVNRRPGIRTIVGLMPRDPEVQNWGLSSSSVVRDPQGAFELHGVRPGSYYLVASSMDEGRRHTAREALEVSDSDVEGIDLVFGPGTDVRGRLNVEGKAPLNLNVLEIWLRPRDENLYFGGGTSVKPDGTFIVSNVSDDNYELQVWGLPEDFYSELPFRTDGRGGKQRYTSEITVSHFLVLSGFCSREAPFLGILRSGVPEAAPRLRLASSDLRRSNLRLIRLPSFWLRKRIKGSDCAPRTPAYSIHQQVGVRLAVPWPIPKIPKRIGQALSNTTGGLQVAPPCAPSGGAASG